MSKSIIKMENVSINFGGLKAVDNFSIDIGENELVGLIGPNGAGKTTVFNIMTGVYQHSEGKYYLNGKEVNGTSTYKLVKNGLARTFQNIRLFDDMTVLDNVLVSMNPEMKYGILSAAFRLPSYWKVENKAREKAYELLKIFNIEEYAQTMAKSLSYGISRKLEIVRAMATNPKILMLDEPAAGMNPIETEELMNTIKLVREKFKISILLIEHDMKLVLGICEKLLVLEYGRVIASGLPNDVIKNEKVISAYLGE